MQIAFVLTRQPVKRVKVVKMVKGVARRVLLPSPQTRKRVCVSISLFMLSRKKEIINNFRILCPMDMIFLRSMGEVGLTISRRGGYKACM